MRWRSTSYAVDERGVHFKSGIVSTKATTVPLSRIQGLDTVAGPVQRLFGVVALHVQSAGGGSKGEIVLEAVGPAAVERIRAAVREQRPSCPRPPRRRRVIERRLGRRELVVAALTAGQLGVVLPVLAASIQLLGNVISSERDIEDATRLLPDTPERLGARPRRAGCWLPGRCRRSARSSRSRASPSRATATACASAAGCSSAPTRSCRSGASTRCASSRACCGARSGSRRCASRSRATPRSASAARTLYPLLRRAEVAAFLAELLPELADEPDGLTAPPARAARRYVLPPGGRRRWSSAAAPACSSRTRRRGRCSSPRCSRSTAGGRFRAAGWRLRDGRLAMRSRMLARTTLLTPAARLQEHAIAQNPFQRRAGLADLAVAVGKGGHARVRHLEAPVAAELWERLRR